MGFVVLGFLVFCGAERGELCCGGFCFFGFLLLVLAFLFAGGGLWRIGCLLWVVVRVAFCSCVSFWRGAVVLFLLAPCLRMRCGGHVCFLLGFGLGWPGFEFVVMTSRGLAGFVWVKWVRVWLLSF